MSNIEKEEKFDFDITPEYFLKLNASPDYIKLCCFCFLNN